MVVLLQMSADREGQSGSSSSSSGESSETKEDQEKKEEKNWTIGQHVFVCVCAS